MATSETSRRGGGGQNRSLSSSMNTDSVINVHRQSQAAAPSKSRRSFLPSKEKAKGRKFDPRIIRPSGSNIDWTFRNYVFKNFSTNNFFSTGDRFLEVFGSDAWFENQRPDDGLNSPTWGILVGWVYDQVRLTYYFWETNHYVLGLLGMEVKARNNY